MSLSSWFQRPITWLKCYGIHYLKRLLLLLSKLGNPNFFVLFIFGRLNLIRSIVRLFNSRPKITHYEVNRSIFSEIKVDDSVKSLQEKGIAFGINLPENVVEEIVDFVKDKPCHLRMDERLGFFYHERKQAEAKYSETFIKAYYLDKYVSCPAIDKVASDPKLLEIAAKYLGTDPVLTRHEFWWLFAGQPQYNTFDDTPLTAAKGGQTFHYDLDDYSNIRFFFFLTNVDLQSGPHTYVLGTHKRKKLKHQLSLSRQRPDKDIIQSYGAENIVTICGKAGFGFAEDTFGFHKANVPISRDRLMLQIRYVAHSNWQPPLYYAQ